MSGYMIAFVISVELFTLTDNHIGGEDNQMGEVRKTRKPRGYWTKENCLKEIQKRYKEGKNLNPASVSKEYGSLYTKSIQLIGSWKDAVEMCGIKYDTVIKKKPNGYWTKFRISEEINRIKETDGDLSSANMLEKYSEIYRVAIKDYGSWDEALKQNKIDYSDHIRKRHNDYWNKERVDNKLDKLIGERSDLTSTYITKRKSGFYKGVIKYYTSWENALESRGISYDCIRLDYGEPIYYGHVFEKVVYEILDELNIAYEKKPILDDGSIPDIKFPCGKIYDIKLSNFTDWGGLKTLDKYGKHSEGIGIIFLRGDHDEEVYEVGEVKFKHINYFVNQLNTDKKSLYVYKLQEILEEINERQAI